MHFVHFYGFVKNAKMHRRAFLQFSRFCMFMHFVQKYGFVKKTKKHRHAFLYFLRFCIFVQNA